MNISDTQRVILTCLSDNDLPEGIVFETSWGSTFVGSSDSEPVVIRSSMQVLSTLLKYKYVTLVGPLRNLEPIRVRITRVGKVAAGK